MQLSRALAIAVGAHLAVSAAIGLTRPRVRVAVATAPAADVEIELTPSETSPLRETRDREPGGAVARGASIPAARAVERAVDRDTSERPTNGALEPDHAAMGWAFRPTTTDLHFHGSSSAMPAGADEVERGRGAPRTTSGGVIEALDTSDREKGLSRGGPAVGAVERAVAEATVMGNATFEVRIDASGAVTVDVVDASRDRTAWAALAAAIRADVVARRDRFRVPPNAKGIRIAVRVEAVDRLPDGRTAPKGLSTHATPGSITEGKDRIVLEPPSASIAYEGKVCSAALSVSLTGPQIAGGCSPENLGSVMVRNVAAHITDESRF